MIDTTTILTSRTMRANLIGLAALVLGPFGFDVSELNAETFAEAAAQLVTASFVASTVFRILATKHVLS